MRAETLNKGFNKIADVAAGARALVEFISFPLHEEKEKTPDQETNILVKTLEAVAVGLLKLAAKGAQTGMRSLETVSVFAAKKSGGRVRSESKF